MINDNNLIIQPRQQKIISNISSNQSVISDFSDRSDDNNLIQSQKLIEPSFGINNNIKSNQSVVSKFSDSTILSENAQLQLDYYNKFGVEAPDVSNYEIRIAIGNNRKIPKKELTAHEIHQILNSDPLMPFQLPYQDQLPYPDQVQPPNPIQTPNQFTNIIMADNFQNTLKNNKLEPIKKEYFLHFKKDIQKKDRNKNGYLNAIINKLNYIFIDDNQSQIII
jgi:hypothetical protein